VFLFIHIPLVVLPSVPGRVASLAPVPQEEVAAAGPTASGPQEEATSAVDRGCVKARGHPRGACHRAGELLAQNCPQHSGPSMANCAGVDFGPRGQDFLRAQGGSVQLALGWRIKQAFGFLLITGILSTCGGVGAGGHLGSGLFTV
jgi:hypothetical protein